MINFRLWPSNQKWQSLEQSLRRSFLSACAILALASVIGILRSGPTQRDLMLEEMVKAHIEQGLTGTKGFNVATRWLTTKTDVFLNGHPVYASSPPLYSLVSIPLYVAMGNNWRAIRMTPVILAFIYLYGVFILAVSSLRMKRRYLLVLFALSPMILIYATELEINTGTVGLALLCYVCILEFLKNYRLGWILWAALFYLLAFWTSYLAASVSLPILAQLLLHPELPRSKRLSSALLWVAFVVLGVGLAVLHLSLIPGALSDVLPRITLRFSGHLEAEKVNMIPFTSFVLRQTVRVLTHFTPIELLLALVAVVRSIVVFGSALIRRRQLDTQEGLLNAINVQLFSWGFPFGVIAINVAYIHPHTLHYFSPFFAFGSMVGLDWLLQKLRSEKARGVAALTTVVIFIILSFARTAYTVSGQGLPELLGQLLPKTWMSAMGW